MTCDAAGSGLAEVSGSWLRGARAGDEEPELVERGQSCSRGAGAAQEEQRLPDRSRSFLGGREEPGLAEGGQGCPEEGAEVLACHRGVSKASLTSRGMKASQAPAD